MATQPTIIQNIAHYGTGDIYASQGIDTRVSINPVLGWLAVGGVAVGVGYIAVQAVVAAAVATAAAVTVAVPYVLGAGAAAAAGIGGVKLIQARQKRTPPRQGLTLCPEALEMAARLADRGVTLTESDLAACERLAQRIKQCASLPPPSSSSGLPLSQSELQYSTSQSKYE